VTRNQQSEIGEENEVVQVTGHRSLVPDLRLAAFGILWFFITLSVESSIIPIIDVIFEHRLYLPSIGFFIALTALVAAGASHLQARMPLTGRLAAIVAALVVLILGGATFTRNHVWKDEETLWLDAKAKSPAKSRPYTNLGVLYGQRERVEESTNAFETAIKLDPRQPEALSNLVLLYLSAGRIRDAEIACATLLNQDPEMKGRLKLFQILRMPDDVNPELRIVRDVCKVSSKAGR
jgi:tetratricopeptide (TPR) repeat protein